MSHAHFDSPGCFEWMRCASTAGFGCFCFHRPCPTSVMVGERFSSTSPLRVHPWSPSMSLGLRLAGDHGGGRGCEPGAPGQGSATEDGWTDVLPRRRDDFQDGAKRLSFAIFCIDLSEMPGRREIKISRKRHAERVPYVR